MTSKEESICAVCLQSESDCLREKRGFVKSQCDHAMCMTCFLQWYEQGGSCPQCRREFSNGASRTVVRTDNRTDVVPGRIRVNRANRTQVSLANLINSLRN